jgi:hypothetical protein
VTGGSGRAPQDDGHAEFEVLAAGWALHALEPDDEGRFAAHLAGCEACRRTTAELADTVGELAYAAPAVEPPPALLERLRAAVAAEEDLSAPVPGDDAPGVDAPHVGGAPGRPVPPVAEPERPAAPRAQGPDPVPDTGPRHETGTGNELGTVHELGTFRGRSGSRDRGSVRERIAWMAAAAAVVVLLAIGGWNVSLRQEVRTQQRIAAERAAMLEQVMQPGRRMAALKSQPGDGQPVAYVLSRRGNLEVATSGMGRNTAGKTSFWLWAIWDGNTRAPLGRFDVDNGEMTLHNLGPVPAHMDTVTLFAVSMEPGTAKPSKPSSIVARGLVDS